MQPMSELELKLYLTDLDRQAIASRGPPRATGGWLSGVIRRLWQRARPGRPPTGATTAAVR